MRRQVKSYHTIIFGSWRRLLNSAAAHLYQGYCFWLKFAASYLYQYCCWLPQMRLQVNMRTFTSISLIISFGAAVAQRTQQCQTDSTGTQSCCYCADSGCFYGSTCFGQTCERASDPYFTSGQEKGPILLLDRLHSMLLWWSNSGIRSSAGTLYSSYLL